MKLRTITKTKIFLLIATLYSCFSYGSLIKVMSYNIRHAQGLNDKVDLKRILEAISLVNPDFVALQEVDSLIKRSGNIDQLKYLANHLGYSYVYSPSIKYKGGFYGNGFLSRFPILNYEVLPLPGREKRSALFVTVSAYAEEISFIATHLDLDLESAKRSIDLILKKASSINDRNVLLLGDLNMQPTNKAMEKLLSSFQFSKELMSGPSFPSKSPQQIIDYIMLHKDCKKIQVENFFTLGSTASDHSALIALMKINE